METHNKLNNVSKNDRIILMILLFLPCLLIRRVLDNDTWFLLNSGRYVMEHGIPYIEPFSIHENMKFVMQQWLTDVIFWNVYNNFGENGLFIIVYICYVIIIYLMFKLTMKISDDNFFISFTITLFSAFLILTYMVTRPTIFTLIIILLELNTLERFVLTGNNKYLTILPILSLLMINLHAALWPVLFVMLLPYIAESFNFNIKVFSNEGFNKKRLFLATLAMLLVALINPYGLDAMTYLLRSTGYSNMIIIMEIQPPNINSFAGALIYIYILLIDFAYIFYRKGKTKIRYFLLTVGTIYMVLASVRNITYFAICSMFPLAYYLKDFNIKFNTLSVKKNNKLRIILIVIIILTLIVVTHFNNKNNNTVSEYMDLNNIIDYIYKHEDITNIVLYTEFNEGSLVQFRGLPSYIDPRAEVYFKTLNNKEDIFNEYFNLKNGHVYYKDIMDKYSFTHLIITKGDILHTYLQKDVSYDIIYENKQYILYKKNNIQ